jgi:DNA-binding transcriptional ArsR family regulator
MSATADPTASLRSPERFDDAQTDLVLTTVLDALSDPVRLQIFVQLSDCAEHMCSSCDLPVAKSTSSHHFRVLRDAGVIETRVDGKRRLNRLRREALDARFPGLIDTILRATRA